MGNRYPTILISGMLVLLLFTSDLRPASSTVHDNLTDLSALMAFKANVDDPYGILASSWTPNTSICNWTGILCSKRRQRVAALRLQGFSLQGTVSPHVANLSFMSHLDLSKNALLGPIPSALGLLPRLRLLNLGSNHLSGAIPTTIFNMSVLTLISLAGNNLSGTLPTTNHTLVLPKLQLITLSYNQLSGEIPSTFGGRSPELGALSLSYNQFSGIIPMELANLPELRVLYLSDNQLTGSIPASVSNLSMLQNLSLGFNNLSGGIPSELGHLQNLQVLKLTSNHLTGYIPSSLTNSSMLRILELAENSFTGPVPSDMFANMPDLKLLNLGGNKLTGTFNFITSLSHCRALENLVLWGNEFVGVLPNSIGNLSTQLVRFIVWGNHVQGGIPAGFGNLSSLLELDLSSNGLQGTILPRDLTRLEKLQSLHLMQNRLDGPIPRELGQMRSLGQLYFTYNNLSGSIPDSVGNMSGLQQLSFGSNSLSSSIPRSIWNLKNLILLDLSDNFLVGSLPHGHEVGSLKVLDAMDLSANRLSGSIPSAIGDLQELEYLDLSHNSFIGLIPQSFGRLLSIKDLNLSQNALSGAVPKSLADLHYLARLNLSFNMLGGEIPEGGVFSNLTLDSLMGNVAFCGALHLGIPPCSTDHSRARLYLLKYILPAAAAAALVLIACIYLVLTVQRRGAAKALDSADTSSFLIGRRFIPYHELVRATDNFSEANLLGRGSFGSVFKGYLDDGLLVAIKVLNLEMEGASRSFDAECRVLCMARHRNLVKIISTCSNLDFKAIILHYMPNGSLERWLYSHNCFLSLLQRISIMLDVALALEYLHDHNVVHCDLKPSNVLLDEDMTAHVGDFGIARLLQQGDSKSLVSLSTPGTFGYMAPEYGLTGRVSRRADVYSYGIMLLETFTRKKPTDAMFSGESNLRQWVSKAYPATILEIVDKNLFRDDTGDDEELGDKFQCLSSVIELGLLCSTDLPNERTLMNDVVPSLEKIRMKYLSKLPHE